jgi:glyoxylase-like metal-dependent hydrolase (beta-lactamase superfamily II)
MSKPVSHCNALAVLKSRRAPIAIGEHVVTVQRIWKDIYNLQDFPADGSQWDRLFQDGERFRVGGIEAEVLFSPGHTAASITYRIGDAVFVHDTGVHRSRLSAGRAPPAMGVDHCRSAPGQHTTEAQPRFFA